MKLDRKVGLEVLYIILKGGICGPRICDTIVQKSEPWGARVQRLSEIMYRNKHRYVFASKNSLLYCHAKKS